MTAEALRAFFAANVEMKNFAIVSQAEYEQKLTDELTSNSKLFHAYLRRKKVGCPSVGPLKLGDGNLTDDPATMAESFALSFEGVYVRTQPDLEPEAHQTDTSLMEPIDLQLQDVLDILQSLDVNSAAGSDEVHPMLLKSCAKSLAYPLWIIYRLSLLECRLPVLWKTSVVAPIFKKGSRYNPLNYRPISLTSVPCKCLSVL